MNDELQIELVVRLNFYLLFCIVIAIFGGWEAAIQITCSIMILLGIVEHYRAEGIN